MNTNGTIKITTASGVFKTISEYEAVKFDDVTVRIVGADGYSSFEEALNLKVSEPDADGSTHLTNLGATFHAVNGDLIYDGFTGKTSSYVDGTDLVNIAVSTSSNTTVKSLIKVLGSLNQTISGANDSDSTHGSNYRDDILFIADKEFSNSNFSVDTDDGTLKIATGTAVKTLSEVEAVKFTDHTVRIVGADGYASLVEAVNSNNSSHASDGDYIFDAAEERFFKFTDGTNLSSIKGSVSSDAAYNNFIKVQGSLNQTISGAKDTDSTHGLNYRDDTLLIADEAFSNSNFSMNTDGTLKIAIGTAVKTVSDIEAVKFSDGTTVRVVGADGYASFLEAMSQDNTSHANNGDYIYGASAKGYTPTATQLDTSESTYLVQIGTSDFYVYHG